MSEMEDTLERIEKEARRLVQRIQELHRELAELKEMQLKLQEASRNKDIVINNLTEQNKVLKLGNALTQKGDSTEIKLKINQLVKEIDRSLAILTKVDRGRDE